MTHTGCLWSYEAVKSFQNKYINDEPYGLFNVLILNMVPCREGLLLYFNDTECIDYE